MKHEQGYFKGAEDKKIYYQYFLPENGFKAGVIVVHGVAEHSGRYGNLVNSLVPSGFAVFGMDHPGHGKSEGKRMYVHDFSEYTKTLKIYFNMIRKWYPDKALFLVGHSMGGLISAAFLLDFQDELAGAVLSGPGLKVPDNISAPVILLGRLLSAFIPEAGLIKLDPRGLSRNPEVVNAYENDPLVCKGKVTARLGAQLIKTMQKVCEKSATITLPVMIVQGGKDTLVDPDGAKLFYDSIQSADKQLKIYDMLFHEVFNEPEHDQVLSDVRHWLLQYI